MENVTDALYMGFAVLAFTLALSICIGAFSHVTQVSDYIVETKDSETQYYDYIEYTDSQGQGITDRIVSAETIIPSLYRSFADNYIIRFKNANGNDITMFQKNGEDINEISLKVISEGNKNKAITFVDNLISGETHLGTNKDYIVQKNNFMGFITGKFRETLGIYYENDLERNSIEDINKTAVRVITYQEVN